MLLGLSLYAYSVAEPQVVADERRQHLIFLLSSVRILELFGQLVPPKKTMRYLLVYATAFRHSLSYVAHVLIRTTVWGRMDATASSAPSQRR